MENSRSQPQMPIERTRALHEGRLLRAPSQLHDALAISDGAARQVRRHAAQPNAAPLIATKVHIPPPSAGLIVRERPLAQLEHGLRQALTLVIAPAGYGKTTLLSAWARQSGMPVAWVSLDADDTAPHRFWAYVIAAIDAAQPGVGTHAQALIDTPAASIEQALATLINALAAARPMALILDDYHLIQADSIHQSLAFLLDHLPGTLHIALASRAEPPVPLAHWRAGGALTELGVADLRFTYAEAAMLIAEIVQQRVPDDDIAMLVEHTEGWAAGLRLAARGARGSADILGFLQGFHGGHRDLQDYLDQEVFAHIPADMQAFVLRCAVLDRLCAPLCAALCEPDEPGNANDGPDFRWGDEPGAIQDAQELLRRVERAGLFLIPLDDERSWYRYHTVFAEALRHRLNHLAPELAESLWQRAAACQAARQGARRAPAEHTLPAGAYQDQHAPAGLAFSKRELEVLRLLAEGCANQDIAQALIIGVNTVKMHLQHLYDKLDVHNRVQAVRRARALGLL
jgi:LuxR family maltose regulon positive regulatory protein